MRRLLRFPGWRRVFALLLGFMITWIASGIFSWRPPLDWINWPYGAKCSVSGLATGSYKIAFCAWNYLLLWPLVERRDRVAVAAGIWLTVVTLGYGFGGSWNLVSGGAYFLSNVNFGGRVIGVTWQVAGWPLLMGTCPLIAVEIFEILEVNAPLRRWTLGGRGHAATWIRKAELKRLCKPIPHGSPPPSGFVGD